MVKNNIFCDCWSYPEQHIEGSHLTTKTDKKKIKQELPMLTVNIYKTLYLSK